jgi:hypothetical protein
MHVEALRKFDECQNVLKQTQSEVDPYLIMEVYSEITLVCNVIAMQKLQSGDIKLCQELLKKAELFSDGIDRMRAVTYNNYACYFRKTN